MFEVRIHGRGGQGVVTAAELLSLAEFEEGHHVQAFPSFGSERTGAPVVSFCRVSENEIRTREPVLTPDALIIQDATLLLSANVFAGLKPDGYVVINTSKTIDELGLSDLLEGRDPNRIVTIPATEIARTYIGRPLPNVVLLGALAALTGRFTVDAVANALRRKFPEKLAAANTDAARAAYALVTKEPIDA